MRGRRIRMIAQFQNQEERRTLYEARIFRIGDLGRMAVWTDGYLCEYEVWSANTRRN